MTTSLKILRPHQEKAIAEVDRLFGSGAKRILLYAPPGTGKTVMASHVAATAQQQGQRVLFLAHRRELIAQTSATFTQAGIMHSIMMSGQPQYFGDSLVQIATVQTLRSRIKIAPKADLVIVDEAHLSAAPSYLQLLDNSYQDARRLGLSGTPERLDGKGLRRVFDELVIVETTEQLVAKNYLMAPTVFAPAKRPDLSKVRRTGGDYSDRDLDALLNTPALCGDIVTHWEKHAAGLSTIVFAVTQSHSKRLRDQFLTAEVTAEHVDCETPKGERDAIFRRLRSGETKVVCNVDICTEGFDYPDLRCVVLARPTQSYARYVQAIGRGMRVAEGKDRFICLDHAGCVFEHGFPTDDREITLDGSKEREPPKLEKCPECAALIRVTDPRCVACGWQREVVKAADEDEPEREAPVRNTANDDQELALLAADKRPSCPECGRYQIRKFWSPKIGVFTRGIECLDRRCRKTSFVPNEEAIASATPAQKQEEFRRLVQVQAARRLPAYWAAWRFKKLFGHGPQNEAA